MQFALRAMVQGWLIVLSKPGYLLLRWLLTLLAGWLVVAPIAELIAEDLDHSLHGVNLVEAMDRYYPCQLAQSFSAELAIFRDTRLHAYLLFAFLAIYLSGGILSGLQNDERRSVRVFFAACWQRFPSLVFVAAVGLAMLILVLTIPVALSYYLPNLIEGPAGQTAAWLLFAFVGLILASWVARFYETWRLMVTEPGRPPRLLGNFGRAFAFNVRQHFWTFPIWVFYSAVHIALFPLYAFMIPYLGFGGENGFLFEVIAGQLFIIARITAGLSFTGGMLSFLRSHKTLPTRTQTEEPALELKSDYEPRPADDAEKPTDDPERRAAEIGADDGYGENKFFRE